MRLLGSKPDQSHFYKLGAAPICRKRGEATENAGCIGLTGLRFSCAATMPSRLARTNLLRVKGVFLVSPCGRGFLGMAARGRHDSLPYPDRLLLHEHLRMRLRGTVLVAGMSLLVSAGGLRAQVTSPELQPGDRIRLTMQTDLGMAKPDWQYGRLPSFARIVWYLRVTT
jgi:hypothetical protein